MLSRRRRDFLPCAKRSCLASPGVKIEQQRATAKFFKRSQKGRNICGDVLTLESRRLHDVPTRCNTSEFSHSRDSTRMCHATAAQDFVLSRLGKFSLDLVLSLSPENDFTAFWLMRRSCRVWLILESRSSQVEENFAVRCGYKRRCWALPQPVTPVPRQQFYHTPKTKSH